MNRARLRPVTQVRDRVTRDALLLRSALPYFAAVQRRDSQARHGRPRAGNATVSRLPATCWFRRRPAEMLLASAQ